MLQTAGGRRVELKVHRCLWSGAHPENSLAAILECYREGVARAEIDVAILADADFLIMHDATLDRTTTGRGRVDATTRREAAHLRLLQDGRPTTERPPLLSEVVEAIRAHPAPTLLELDLVDFRPWPWARVEELVRLVEPVRERIVFGSCADWNLRRLLTVDSSLPVGFNPAYYLDWSPPGAGRDPLPRNEGAYGYLDDHPLALQRLDSVTEYLRDRLRSLVQLVPGAREVHLSLDFFERMLADGLAEAAGIFQGAGLLVDVWTLDAGTPRWQERLARAVGAGVDIVTTNTPRELARHARHQPIGRD